MKLKVIIFDLDDTLYKEMTFVKSGFKAVAGYIGGKFKINKNEFSKVLKQILEKEGRGHIFNIALKKYNLYNEELLKQLIEVYRSHKPNIKPYLDAKNLLTSLKKKYKLALITDGLGYIQRNKVKALGIEKFFDLIIYTDDWDKQKSKPNKFSLKKVLSHFNITPKETIVIGDNPRKDFLGAKALGVKTIRILRGRYRSLKVSNNLDANYKVGKFKKIPKIINLIETTKDSKRSYLR